MVRVVSIKSSVPCCTKQSHRVFWLSHLYRNSCNWIYE